MKIVNNYKCFDVSEGKENYSQRNNKFQFIHPKNPNVKTDKNSMCNFTSAVMAASYNNWVFPPGAYEQDEDNACAFAFNNQEVLDYYKKVMPVLYKDFEDGKDGAYCPNEVHLVLAFSFNKWIGATVLQFIENAKIEDIFEQIIEKDSPVVMSGTFPYTYANGTKGVINHINVLVGLAYEQSEIIITKETKPSYVIIDDPYGDWSKNFAADSNRNNVWMPYDKFIEWYKPVNKPYKYAHFVKKGAALV